MAWLCPACEYENEASADTCEACEEPRPESSTAGEGGETDPYANFKVGIIEECEDAPGTKLKLLKVNVGEAELLDVVTNAPNVRSGSRVVIACAGAIVGEETVKRTQVKGHASNGMVCDGPMLGWTGGGAGTAALLPDTCEPGTRPPSSRPRGGPGAKIAI